MSDLQLFSFEGGQEIQTQLSPEGDPLVCAADLARYLGVNHPEKTYSRVDPAYKVMSSNHTLGGSQKMLFLREPGVYELLLTTRLRKNNPNYEKVRGFRRWVFEEVLPSIRRHGEYKLPKKVEFLTLWSFCTSRGVLNYSDFSSNLGPLMTEYCLQYKIPIREEGYGPWPKVNAYPVPVLDGWFTGAITLRASWCGTRRFGHHSPVLISC